MTSKTTPLKKKKIISSSKSFHFSSFYGVVYVGFRICVEIKSKNIPSKKLLFIIHQCFRELFQEVLTENLVFQLANFYALILSDITKFLTIAAAVLRPPWKFIRSFTRIVGSEIQLRFHVYKPIIATKFYGIIGSIIFRFNWIPHTIFRWKGSTFVVSAPSRDKSLLFARKFNTGDLKIFRKKLYDISKPILNTAGIATLMAYYSNYTCVSGVCVCVLVWECVCPSLCLCVWMSLCGMSFFERGRGQVVITQLLINFSNF